MDRVVHGAVHQVAQQKAGEEHESIAAHDQVHQSEYGRRNDQAGYGRHEQSLPVTGIVMVVAVQGINELGGSGRFGHPVKNITVCDVFEECPEEHPCKEHEQDPAGTVIIFCSRGINDKTEDGDIHAPDHQRVGLGQRLQEIIFEQPGLAFIMDFFEMHGAKIRNVNGEL